MKQITWGSLVGGLGLLCLLGIFALLASNGSLSVSPVPATPIVRSTVGMTASAVISQSHVISASQAITYGSWLTFTDSEAEYSLRYPPNSYINSGQSKGQTYRTVDIGFQIPNQRYQGMSIRVEPNPQNLPINQFLNEFYQKVKEAPLNVEAANSLEELEIASITAYKTNILYGDVQILLPYNRKVYIFSLGYTIAGGGSSSEARAMFSQILGTFQVKP